MNQATAAIEPINTALRNLKPIVNETGKDNEALIKTLTGINPDSPKQRGLLQWLGEGALNVVSGAASAVGNAVVSPAKGATKEPVAKDFSLASYAPEEVKGGISDEAFQTANLDGISFDGEAAKTMTATGGVKGLLDKIGQGEAGGSYNRLFGGREAPLTEMTLGQVMSLQNQMKQKGSPSTAVGKYQFINSTLGNIARKMGIGPNEPFNEETQDKLALGLLKGRGLDDFMSGKLSRSAFIDNIAQEWAIVKGSSGRGAYDGDGLNRAALNIGDFVDSLKSGGFSGKEKAAMADFDELDGGTPGGPTMADPVAEGTRAGGKDGINALLNGALADGKKTYSELDTQEQIVAIKELRDRLNNTWTKNTLVDPVMGESYEQYLERGVGSRKRAKDEFTPVKELTLDEIKAIMKKK
jgi:hypothetical protein